MVQNASSNPKRLGRTPGFDRETVVSQAMVAFWSKGFAATTLTDLEDATGVNRSTLYNSFGGKYGLYHSAAAAYVDSSEEALFEPLYHGTDGIADIVEFLDRLAGALGSDDNPPGCLIVNDMADTIDHAATDRYLDLLQGGITSALQRASTENDHDTALQRCQFLTAAVIGINLLHRNAGDPTTAQTLIAGTRAQVSTWST